MYVWSDMGMCVCVRVWVYMERCECLAACSIALIAVLLVVSVSYTWSSHGCANGVLCLCCANALGQGRLLGGAVWGAALEGGC